jgi:hypothetical protein
MESKIITLSVDDPVAAKALLQEWLDMDDKILFIVLGTTNIAKETVRRADKLSGGNLDEPQWVIHAPVREDVTDLLSTLEDPDDLVEDWEKPLAVVISITDVIRDMIVRDGTQPTFSRIDDAYRAAEIDSV